MTGTLPTRQRHELDDLRWHWPVYLIGAFVTPEGDEVWSASAAGDTICARSAATLRLRICAHYDKHPELHNRPEGLTERSET